jgi:hypothetical protein
MGVTGGTARIASLATPPTLSDDVGRVVDETLDLLLGTAVHATTTGPSWLLALIAGVVVWRGSRPAAGATVALLVAWLGALSSWPITVETTVVAILGTALTPLVLAPASLWWRDRDHSLHARPTAARSTWIAISLLAAITALVLVAGGPVVRRSPLPWILLVTLAVSIGLVLLAIRTRSRLLRPSTILRAGSLGLVAATLVGIPLQRGLGGTAARALTGVTPLSGLPLLLAVLLTLLASLATLISTLRVGAARRIRERRTSTPSPGGRKGTAVPQPADPSAGGQPERALEGSTTDELRVPPTAG